MSVLIDELLALIFFVIWVKDGYWLQMSDNCKYTIYEVKQTKLCIRDNLYHLARSAQQRHDYANLTGGPGDVRNFVIHGTNKGSGFMDMETDTNPIDRSRAHLLFHRPTDLPVMPCPES